MKELFVISDVHGHYDCMMRDLKNSGYDENNENHLLIVLGDLFDRGEQSVEIFRYLYKLQRKGKAIVLKGNHEPFLIDFLNGEDCTFNYNYNGFDKTIDSFLGEKNAYGQFTLLCSSHDSNIYDFLIAKYGNDVKLLLRNFNACPREIAFEVFQNYARKYIKKHYPRLRKWLESLPYYYETEQFIFTHASIDTTVENWKEPEFSPYAVWSAWQYLTWNDGTFFGKEINNTDKTVVVGHFHTDQIRKKYNLGNVTGENKILVRDDNRVIMIDTCTVVTKKVNVLKVVDKLL